MTNQRTAPDDAPNSGGRDTAVEDIVELQGDELPIDQDAVVDADEIEEPRRPTLSEQEWGIVEPPSSRAGETTDPLVAIEEGQTYIPPTDPPIVPARDEPEGIETPRGDRVDAEGDINARIRDELRSDAATTALADRLQIAVLRSTAIIRGQVDGIEDTDAIVEVASRVEGISEVRDETDVAGL
jgi:hypothetical protein